MDADTLILLKDLAAESFGSLRPVVIGTCGGLAAVVATNRRPDAKAFIYCVVVSGFAAWLAGKFSATMPVSSDHKDAIMGVAGLTGAFFLTAISKKVAGSLGLELSADFDLKEKGKDNKTRARRQQPPQPVDEDPK